MLLAAALAGPGASDSTTLHQIVLAPAETLTVAVRGTGTPVVLVPGLFGSRYAFRTLAPALADEGFQTIIIEPLGIGTSARPKLADYSLTAQAGRLAAVLDTLGITSSIVIAHSLGAGMTFRLAVLRPELVRGIVSIEGGPVESATTPGLRFWLRLSGLLKLLGDRVVLDQVERSLKSSSGDSTWVTPEVVAGYTAGIVQNMSASFDALKGMARAEEPWTLAPTLHTILGPVRLLIGAARHQSGMPAREITQLAASLPAFTVDSIAGAGHYIFEESPAAVVRAVREMRRDLVGRQ